MMEQQPPPEQVSQTLKAAYAALFDAGISVEERRLLTLGLRFIQSYGAESGAAGGWTRIQQADPRHGLAEELRSAIWSLRMQLPELGDAAHALEEVVDRVRRGEGERALAEAVRALGRRDFQGHVQEGWPSNVMRFLEETAGDGSGSMVPPNDVVDLMVRLVDPRPGERILDPACGTGAFLVRAAQWADGAKHGLHLHGQERNRVSLAMAHLNLRLHGAGDAVLREGDVLVTSIDDPGSYLRRFDCVVTAPPFGATWRPRPSRKPGPVFPFGIPPRHSADFAYLQQAATSLSDGGRGAVLVPPGVLFRGGEQGKIRRGMLDADLVEAVVALPRKLLHQYAGTSAVMLLRSRKPAERQRRVLFVDASESFEPRRSRNRLRMADVSLIVNAVRDFREEPGKSAVADLNAIRDANYDLNLSRWVETVISPVEMDFNREITDLVLMEHARDEAAAAVDALVARVTDR